MIYNDVLKFVCLCAYVANFAYQHTHIHQHERKESGKKRRGGKLMKRKYIWTMGNSNTCKLVNGLVRLFRYLRHLRWLSKAVFLK